eukprot:scaffold3860_cov51-Phaeocystis_antarctica.AAC.2
MLLNHLLTYSPARAAAGPGRVVRVPPQEGLQVCVVIPPFYSPTCLLACLPGSRHGRRDRLP